MADKMARVLVVDDDLSFATDITDLLDGNFETGTCCSAEEAVVRLGKESFDVLLLDIELGDGMDGLTALEYLKKLPTSPAVIMLTRSDDVISIVKAIRGGAYHYLCKPPNKSELLNLINHCVTENDLRRQVEAVRDQQRRQSSDFIAEDRKSLAILREIELAAPTDATTLITGECGSGKGMVARRLHELSNRSEGQFFHTNCAALNEHLLESELFGHVKGSFTDASQNKRGIFELASGGTLFLDEIGDASPGLQVKLLTILEDQTFRRVGGEDILHTDVRIVAATSRDLESEISAGRFNQALFYRLNLVRLHVPPLRQRSGDILPLARHFLVEATVKYRRDVSSLSENAQTWLLEQPWPGNVRELRNTIQRAVLGCLDEQLSLGDMVSGCGSQPDLKLGYHEAKAKALHDFKMRYVSHQLKMADGSIPRAAEWSGLKRQVFGRMHKELMGEIKNNPGPQE